MKALARAFRYQNLLDEGRYANISEMAAGEKIERGYLGTLLRLTLLAAGFSRGAPEWAAARGGDAAAAAGGGAGGVGGSSSMKFPDCRILGKIRDEKSGSSKRWVPCIYQSITVLTLDRVHDLNGKCAYAVEPNGERT